MFPNHFYSMTWSCLHGSQKWEAPGGVCLAALLLMHYLAWSERLCAYLSVFPNADHVSLLLLAKRSSLSMF